MRKKVGHFNDVAFINQTLQFLGSHPCRCLWVGSEQITRTVPLRRTSLQFRHNFFTEALTFIAVLHWRYSAWYPHSPGQARLAQQAFVLTAHQVGLHLGHEVHGHHNDDQQRGTAKIEGDIPFHDHELGQQTH
jgi:hypothetical protein